MGGPWDLLWYVIGLEVQSALLDQYFQHRKLLEFSR
jgi:hypothetical protein